MREETQEDNRDEATSTKAQAERDTHEEDKETYQMEEEEAAAGVGEGESADWSEQELNWFEGLQDAGSSRPSLGNLTARLY